MPFCLNDSFISEVLDWKTKYDESENPFVRVVRGTIDRVGHAFGKYNFGLNTAIQWDTLTLLF